MESKCQSKGIICYFLTFELSTLIMGIHISVTHYTHYNRVVTHESQQYRVLTILPDDSISYCSYHHHL